MSEIDPRRRREAANALALMASNLALTMDEAIGECVSGQHHAEVRRAAWPALAAACGSRYHVASETRAEAEAMLRTGWAP